MRFPTSRKARTPEPTAHPSVSPETTPPPATKVSKLAASLRAARPVVAQTIVVAVPPAPEVAPTVSRPTEPPAFTLPAACVCRRPRRRPGVHAAGSAPQPRLRDRILERIPIINRFHEPQYQQPR